MHSRNFKKNYFRDVAILGAVFLSTLLFFIFHYVNTQLQSEIEKAGEVSNATLTRVFVNETWAEISAFLPPPNSDVETIRENSNIKKIDNRMRRFMSYTDVLKVKLYNTSGLTTYSSEFDQIGENKASNLGFQQALKGNLASELIYRGKFGAFDGELYSRNLVSTYAPIRDGAQVIAVAELYSDRTSSINQASNLRNKLIAMLVLTLLCLYVLFLFSSYKIYSRIHPQAKKISDNNSDNVSTGGAENQALQKTNAPHEYLFPIPDMSLIGLGQLIQRISLYGIKGLPQETIKQLESSLPELSKNAGAILDRIVKYRGLVQQDFSVFKSNSTKINFDELVEFISNYSEKIGVTNSIKFFQGHHSSNGFIQSTDAIKLVITSYIDFVSFGLQDPKIEIKFHGDSDGLGIEFIVQSQSTADKPINEVFHELNQQIDAFAQSFPFKYKATLSHNGLLVSISMLALEYSKPNLMPQDSEALIFCSSALDSGFLSALLKKRGINKISTRNHLNFYSSMPIPEKCFIFIYRNHAQESLAEFNKLIDHLKNFNVDPKNITVLTAESNWSSDSDFSYQKLAIPFNDESLARLSIG